MKDSTVPGKDGGASFMAMLNALASEFGYVVVIPEGFTVPNGLKRLNAMKDINGRSSVGGRLMTELDWSVY